MRDIRRNPSSPPSRQELSLGSFSWRKEERDVVMRRVDEVQGQIKEVLGIVKGFAGLGLLP